MENNIIESFSSLNTGLEFYTNGSTTSNSATNSTSAPNSNYSTDLSSASTSGTTIPDSNENSSGIEPTSAISDINPASINQSGIISLEDVENDIIPENDVIDNETIIYNNSEEETLPEEELYPNSQTEVNSVITTTTTTPNVSRDIPTDTNNIRMYKPYDTPININISYNTKSSTNTDDIINIKERFSKPDSSNYMFNNHIPSNSTVNQENLEITQEQDVSNNTAPESRCNASVSNSDLSSEVKDNSVYNGYNFEYINPDIIRNDPRCNNKKNVCPMEINQNWSDWNPQYLSGDDINNNMVSQS